MSLSFTVCLLLVLWMGAHVRRILPARSSGIPYRWRWICLPRYRWSSRQRSRRSKQRTPISLPWQTVADMQAGSQMIFIPDDFSNTYLVSHWTNPGDYASTDGAPYATDLINSTQILPAPSDKDTQAAYAASPSDVVQVASNGDIYYIAGAISNYQVASGASWTKMGYSLAGLGGGSSSTGSSSSMSGSASATSSGTASPSASGSGSGSGASSASSGAASATQTPNAGSSTTALRLDVAGAVMGLITLGTLLVI